MIYTTIRRLRVSCNGTTFTNDADTLYFRSRASMGNFLLHNACLKMVSCGGFIAHTFCGSPPVATDHSACLQSILLLLSEFLSLTGLSLYKTPGRPLTKMPLSLLQNFDLLRVKFKFSGDLYHNTMSSHELQWHNVYR